MSCAAPPGGTSTEGIDLAKESVIEGLVTTSGEPVSGAYVRLLDSSGEFTAEVPTNEAGEFRFFAAPGNWTLRTLAAGTSPVDRAVVAQQGLVAAVEVAV